MVRQVIVKMGLNKHWDQTDQTDQTNQTPLRLDIRLSPLDTLFTFLLYYMGTRGDTVCHKVSVLAKGECLMSNLSNRFV